jgi:hypothetical protein
MSTLLSDVFSSASEPPGKWTLCPLPDSAGKNAKNASYISRCLNDIEIVEFIERNPDEKRRVTDAKSRAERLEILQNKFIFHWDAMPTIGNVLLYDDKVSSGDTLDYVFQAMRRRSPELGITALAAFVYIGKKVESPQVLRLKETTREDVVVEEPAQV